MGTPVRRLFFWVLLVSGVGGRESLIPQATSGRDHEGDQLRLLGKSITQIYLGYKVGQELMLKVRGEAVSGPGLPDGSATHGSPGHTHRPAQD